MGIRVFKAINPKSREAFEVWATLRDDDARNGSDPYPWWVLEAYPWKDLQWPAEKTAVGRVVLVGDTGRGRVDHVEIHSRVKPEWRRAGVGTLLYITAAVFVAQLGYRGIYSASRTEDADALWDRLVAAGLAVSEPPSRYLDAKVARATKLVTYVGRYGHGRRCTAK